MFERIGCTDLSAAVGLEGGAPPVSAPEKRASTTADAAERSAGFLRFASPEALFRCHYSRLVRTLSVVADGDRPAAEDAAQDAFVQLCVHWDRVKTYDEPAAWVRRVAIRRLSNRRRGLLRRAAALVRLERIFEREEIELPDPTLDLAAALSRLSEQQRFAVALHYVDGLPITEVALSMGITAGSVNRHLHRARAALRPILEVNR